MEETTEVGHSESKEEVTEVTTSSENADQMPIAPARKEDPMDHLHIKLTPVGQDDILMKDDGKTLPIRNPIYIEGNPSKSQMKKIIRENYGNNGPTNGAAVGVKSVTVSHEDTRNPNYILEESATIYNNAITIKRMASSILQARNRLEQILLAPKIPRSLNIQRNSKLKSGTPGKIFNREKLVLPPNADRGLSLPHSAPVGSNYSDDHVKAIHMMNANGEKVGSGQGTMNLGVNPDEKGEIEINGEIPDRVKRMLNSGGVLSNLIDQVSENRGDPSMLPESGQGQKIIATKINSADGGSSGMPSVIFEFY